jgi:threonine/homoserine/homoserine lactone efflux protein
VIEVLVSGWLIGVAIALPVGPVITELIRRGLRGGFLPAWLVGLGAAASHAILVALTLLGVVALLDHAVWHLVLGVAGVLVLGYLGVQAVRTSAQPGEIDAAPSTGHPFLAGFGIGIANPITLLWFLTVGGGLIAGHAGGRAALAAIFGASFVVGVLCWDTAVAALAGYGRRWLGHRALRALNVMAGVIFFGFAVRLLLQLPTLIK